jgi:hypothetical protein
VALVTEAIKISTEGIGSEVVLPQAPGEEMDVEGGMGVHALPDIHKADIGIDALQATPAHSARTAP